MSSRSHARDEAAPDRGNSARDADGEPAPALVFVEKVRNALRLAAVGRAARRLGLVPGLTLADARARIPGLVVAEMDRAADAALVEQIADFCDRYTPLVALDPPDGLILDITGCAHLFKGEANLRDDLVGRCARAGVEARTAIAGTPQTARALARFGATAIIPPGGEAKAVRPLPTAALGIDPDTAIALGRAGLKTIGDLEPRPWRPLAARFGEDLVAALRRTLGREDIRITPRRPLPACSAERGFAEPLLDAEAALGVLASLGGQVMQALERRGEGGRSFEACFFRTDGKLFRLAVETGRPMRDAKALMRLFTERLDALADPLDPGFGFDLIRLSVMAGEPFATAQAGLDGRAVEEEEVAALVDRLGARFGVQAVQRFEPADTHIPERAVRTVAAAARTGANPAWPAPEADMPPARPIHLFDPPQPIETLAEVPEGPPIRFRWRRVLREVARAEGPERIAPEWWRGSGELTRDYYRVEDVSGHRFWVYREGLYEREAETPRWFLHGIFA